MSEAGEPVPARPAASAVIVRRVEGSARVLMGQRGREARFMPDRVVFPGGAVDPEDADRPAPPASDPTRRRLAHASGGVTPSSLIWAAAREVFEETGLVIAPSAGCSEAVWRRPDVTWPELVASDYAPCGERMRFFFRAITPESRPVRFDARFFLMTADDIAGGLDALDRGSGELSALEWLSFEEAYGRRIPFITREVLKEAELALAQAEADRPAPFFHSRVERDGPFEHIA
ncbi:MAG: NUDIX domain-containing protein [Caulobacterales bacterium]|nr:NUDIX domain-containing protein [Caulobacterales bacterium]